ncbi:MAG: caspase family protein, partial [Spirochaetaceae bacterium]|nr:caspase family protein [Spirochaetaceae bacterium]
MKRISAFLVFFCLAGIAAGFGDFEGTTRRFGIFIGANNGGSGRITLRYAVSDARAMAQIFTEMGGIRAEDMILLVEPSIRDIEQQLSLTHQKIVRARESYKRTELVFYYSGHSDEEGLLLNRQRLFYRDLRARITALPSEMRIVILDSCASGAFTRAKGGTKTVPFLIDDSISAEGYAFLTSSSATEASQESDSIGGSYFTHSLITGLRGGADLVGDGRVTLNEVYRFAYAETLAKTETSLYGVQHPSYDMQISGSGDVVLTDVKETSAGLVFGAELTGRITIRDSSDFLMAELTKVQNRPLEIGLGSGRYHILLQRGDSFFRAEVLLVENRRVHLNLADFSPVGRSPAVARGDVPAGDESGDEAYPLDPLKFQLLPDAWLGREAARTTNNLLFALLAADGWQLNGLGMAFLGVSTYGSLTGAQLAGIYATTAKNMTGVQLAGILNFAGGPVQGVQFSGLVNLAQDTVLGAQGTWGLNIAGNDLTGVQAAGSLNIVDGSVTGVQQAGLCNWAGGSLQGVQLAGILNMASGGARGVQETGVVNIATGDMTGLQMAGILNWSSGAMRGLQFGLVNYSGQDSAGLRIGLINISRGESVLPIGLV